MSNPMLDFRYNVAIEGDFEPQLVKWGEMPGSQWVDKLRTELDTARQISLVPKDPKSILPVVSVQVGDGRRWILFSRVLGEISSDATMARRIRVYCLGWQSTVRGANVQSKMWVYQDGNVELGEVPSLAKYYLNSAPVEEIENGSD